MISNAYEREFTPARRAILTQLAEYKFLTTAQIHQLVQPDKRLQQTQGDLARLREWQMVESFAAEPDRGTASPFCWLLLQRGADVIGLANYGSHYRRQPTRERLVYREQELELEHALRAAGWEFLRPVTYSRAHPMPKQTPHYTKLVEMLAWIEYTAIQEAKEYGEEATLGNRAGDYAAKRYTHYPPVTANDYVIYQVKPYRAAVLILCPPSATGMFWKRRIEAYTRLAQHLFVIAIFANEAQAYARRDPIKRAGLRVTSLENMPKMLKALQASVNKA